MPAPQARPRIHDDFQLELKLETPWDPANTRGSYDFDAWFYFPPQLGIDEPGFDRDQFYADLTAYLRFQTPRMSLERLLGKAADKSPFAWLTANETLLTSGEASPADLRMAIRELRLFAAVLRAILRDEGHFLSAQLGNGAPLPQLVADVAAASDRFVAESAAALHTYRELRRRFLEARTPDLLRDAFTAIDDFLSLQAVESWFALLAAMGPLRDGHAPAVSSVERLRDAVLVETKYRVASGYQGEIDEHDTAANERFVARLNLLKKYVLEVLHLQQQSTRRRERIQDALFGIAAAVAMAIAVGLQLLALWTVGNPSPQTGGSTLVAFVVLAVGGYILKDRVKERLKQWFQAGLPRWLFDRRQNLCVEASHAIIGAVEETVRLVRPADLPHEVTRTREHGEEPLFAGHRAAEDVIHYRRHVEINGPAARREGPEMSALSEILRFNVHRWLRRMDEPTRLLFILEDDGTTRRVSAPKTYRVNLILGLPSPNGKKYHRYCLVLSREGILRIEPVATA